LDNNLAQVHAFAMDAIMHGSGLIANSQNVFFSLLLKYHILTMDAVLIDL
jgi:hypothetical protein